MLSLKKSYKCANMVVTGGDVAPKSYCPSLTTTARCSGPHIISRQTNPYTTPSSHHTVVQGMNSGVILDRVSFHGRFVHFHLPSFLFPSFQELCYCRGQQYCTVYRTYCCTVPVIAEWY